jgi:hypothetical protein
MPEQAKIPALHACFRGDVRAVIKQGQSAAEGHRLAQPLHEVA